MKLHALFCLLVAGSFSLAACAQQKRPWNNKRCAVVLSYDDALHVHLDKVVPALDKYGFKGTFYLIASRRAFTGRMPEWQTVARNGHELGNHTLFHPCAGDLPGREWVQPEYDLSTYTIRRMTDEIRVTNALLKSVDGKSKRTLGCPCGDTRVRDSSYLHAVSNEFVAFRDGRPDAVTLNRFGDYVIQWSGPSGTTGEEMIAQVKKAMQDNALLICVFHGVGGEHNLNVSEEAHEQLLQFLQQNIDDIWVAPFIEVAEYMQRDGGQKKQ